MPADRVVVVTGASSGVGRACARAFGRQGDCVALLARNAEALENAAGEIEQAGGQALVCTVDMADAGAVEAAAAAVEARWGRIDVWVNNAMVTVFAPAMDTTAEEFRRVTEVTYLGYVNGTQAALRRMLPANSGLSYRSAPLSPTAPSPCSPPTAPPRRRSAPSLTRCAPNCSTTTAASGSARSTSQR